MLSADDVAFLKALVSPAALEELRKAVASKKNLRSPTNPASHRQPHQSAPKRKATEFSGPSDPMEPAARRPASAPGADQAAPSDRQLGSPEGGVTYAAVAAASAAPLQPGGPLKPTAKGLVSTKPAASPEAAPGRTPNDVSGPLSGMPVGATTTSARAANTSLPAGERPNKTPIFISRVGDTRAFLAWLRSSCPCELSAQLG